MPLSYRSAPFAGSEAFLVGTSEHGVLGKRWFADAAGDPVYRSVLAATIAQGGREADEFSDDGTGALVPRDLSTRVRGSGEPGRLIPDLSAATVSAVGHLTRLDADSSVLDILRIVDPAAVERDDQLTLRATWPGQTMPAILATLE